MRSDTIETMSRIVETYLRSELERRQGYLQSALASRFATPELAALLGEVDSALARFQNGTYGLCESCHDPLERDRLLVDPLARFCLDDLTESERRALEHDLRFAARIQRGLLPPRHLPTPGWRVAYEYQPAGIVSGDYCDLFASRGELLFLCGDVSGKGVAASLLMSHLHATFRSLADAALPLEEMVDAANRIFLESTIAGQFATLVVGRALPDGTIQLVNAGHLPALHLSTSVSNPIGSTAVPLGMFSSAHFSAQNLFLAPDETLLVYTDGATEAQDRSGNEFGIDRLKSLAARHAADDPETLIADCLESLKRFTAGRPFHDDFTMLAISRRS